MEPKYIYKATMAKDAYDADTLKVHIDLGFGVILKNQTLRLFGIDAWEVRGGERERGIPARDWIREQLPAGADFVIQSKDGKAIGADETGKYGRWLIVVFKGDRNLNEELVELGHAEIEIY